MSWLEKGRVPEFISEEQVINDTIAQIESDLAAGKQPMVFIPDATGMGPSHPEAVAKTLEIANKVKAHFEQQGKKVAIERDPADFREFDFVFE